MSVMHQWSPWLPKSPKRPEKTPWAMTEPTQNKKKRKPRLQDKSGSKNDNNATTVLPPIKSQTKPKDDTRKAGNAKPKAKVNGKSPRNPNSSTGNKRLLSRRGQSKSATVYSSPRSDSKDTMYWKSVSWDEEMSVINPDRKKGSKNPRVFGGTSVKTTLKPRTWEKFLEKYLMYVPRNFAFQFHKPKKLDVSFYTRPNTPEQPPIIRTPPPRKKKIYKKAKPVKQQSMKRASREQYSSSDYCDSSDDDYVLYNKDPPSGDEESEVDIPINDEGDDDEKPYNSTEPCDDTDVKESHSNANDNIEETNVEDHESESSSNKLNHDNNISNDKANTTSSGKDNVSYVIDNVKDNGSIDNDDFSEKGVTDNAGNDSVGKDSTSVSNKENKDADDIDTSKNVNAEIDHKADTPEHPLPDILTSDEEESKDTASMHEGSQNSQQEPVVREELGRLTRDPDWLDEVAQVTNECVTSYIREITAARIAKNKDKLQEQMEGRLLSKDGDMPVVRLPSKVVWKNKSISTLKYQIGEAVDGEHYKTILLVGPKNSGKSTLAECMINYMFGLEKNESFKVQLPCAQETGCIIAYSLPSTHDSKLSYGFNIIEFPGFEGDDMTMKSREWLKNFHHFFFKFPGKHRIDTVDAVCFVKHARDGVITPQEKYIYQEIVYEFGNGIIENMFGFFNCRDGNPDDFDLDLDIEANELTTLRRHYFSKDGIYGVSAEEGSCHSRRDLSLASSDDEIQEARMDFSNSNFEPFYRDINNLPPKRVNIYGEDLHMKRSMNVSLQYLKVLAKERASQLSALQQERQLALENKGKRNVEVKYDVYSTKQIQNEVIPSENLYYCAICLEKCPDGKKSDKCKSCVGKCICEHHFNPSYTYDVEISQEERLVSDLLARYSHSKKIESFIDKTHADIKAKLQLVMKKIGEYMAEVNKTYHNNGSPTEQAVEFLICDELRKGQPGWKERVRTLEEEFKPV